MDIEQLVLIITNVIFAFIYIYVIFLFFGIGGSMLAGFNTTVRYKNDKKAYKYLLRMYSIVTFVVILFTHAGVLCFIFEQKIIGGVLLAMIIPICIISVLLLRKNKKFMKAYRQSTGILINKDEQLSNQTNDTNTKSE